MNMEEQECWQRITPVQTGTALSDWLSGLMSVGADIPHVLVFLMPKTLKHRHSHQYHTLQHTFKLRDKLFSAR